MIHKKLLILLLFTFSLQVSCDNGRQGIPEGIISRDSMVSLMADIHVAEARLMIAGNLNGKRDLKAAYMQQVLSDAKVDTTRFLKSFDFYATHPEIFSVMYEDVVVEISKRQAELKTKD